MTDLLALTKIVATFAALGMSGDEIHPTGRRDESDLEAEDALLIAARDRSDKVKTSVDRMRREDRADLR